MTQVIILIALLAIMYSLASALYLLTKNKQEANMARALSYRIGLSVSVFIFLFVAFSQGWIQPHSLGKISAITP